MYIPRTHDLDDPPSPDDSAAQAHPADPREPGQEDISSGGQRVFLPRWRDVRALLAITLAAIALASWWWWSGQPQEASPLSSAPVKSASEASGQPIQSTPASSMQPLELQEPPRESSTLPASALITVDIRGAVTRRGIQRLPAGSRVIDAIQAAGGVRLGRAYGSVNLAKVLDDGEQIHVGKADTSSTLPSLDAAPGGASSGTGPVNINTAAEVALETLPGVGPVLAARIVDWRQQNGAFRSVDDLLQVVGIGDKVLEGLRPEVTL